VEALAKTFSDSIALLSARFESEFAEHRENFVALKTIVASLELDVQTRDLDVHDAFVHTLRGMLDSRAVPAEKGATGILRAPSDSLMAVYHSPDFNCKSHSTFRGDCFIHSAPRTDGWWDTGDGAWVHARSATKAGCPLQWLSATEYPGAYQTLLPGVRVWYLVRGYEEIRNLTGRLDGSNRDDLFNQLESRLASRTATPSPIPAAAPLEATSPFALEAMADVQTRAREAELLGVIAALEARLVTGAAPTPRHDIPSVQACSLLEDTKFRRAAQSAADRSCSQAASAQLEKVKADAAALVKGNRKLQQERDLARAQNVRLTKEAAATAALVAEAAIARECALGSGSDLEAVARLEAAAEHEQALRVLEMQLQHTRAELTSAQAKADLQRAQDKDHLVLLQQGAAE
jgi:hypothetical protein